MATKLTNVVTAVISNGTSLTIPISLGNYRLAGIQMPTAWTSAALTFQASTDGVTYTDLYDAFGAEVNITVAASTAVALDVTQFAAFPYLKIRSGTTGSAVSQGADRTLSLATMALVG